jgi:HK97 gp10 family phage protein
MSFTFKIVKRGDKFAQMERRAPEEAESISDDTAKAVKTIARQLSPVSNNNEAGHIHMRDTIYIEEISRTRRAVGVKAPYAPHVEYGTVYMDAQPFMEPAMELARREYDRRRLAFFETVAR